MKWENTNVSITRELNIFIAAEKYLFALKEILISEQNT